jgi:hypothetical protein
MRSYNMHLSPPRHGVQVVACATRFKVGLWVTVSFSSLAEVEDGRGALAIEDGPCTFTETSGLLGYSKCSDDSQIMRKGRQTTASFRH